LLIVPQNKDLKRLVRARMAQQTGERYTDALAQVLHQTELGQTKLGKLPAPWFLTGTLPADYELGLLPEDVSFEGHRVVRLRLRSEVAAPAGFGALMQSIAATRYRGCRVRFSATVRAQDVTGWAGLWLRIDGPVGPRALDNMQDRAVRGSTVWSPAAVVLDVPEHATSLHFGALLDGAGAVDIARPQFEEASDAVPTGTVWQPLPDAPQALDFDAVALALSPELGTCPTLAVVS
jgi:hypothetical protein